MQRRIPEEIKAIIFQSAEPWFPSLSELLATTAWEKISSSGIVPYNYGTHRCLRKDPATDLQYPATLGLGNDLQCRLEILPEASREVFEEAGLIFAPCSSIEVNVPIIQSALSLIATTPTLSSVIAHFLRSLHLLKAPDENYDVSHSDPSVPFSIFVSIPPVGRHERLRLAESIVHECMHLQLTAFEALFPLVGDHNEVAYSPWRLTERPLAGVIHGLYVFTVIHSWFEILNRCDFLSPEERKFVEKRLEEVAREVAHVITLPSKPGLTDAGYGLTSYLFRCLGL